MVTKFALLVNNVEQNCRSHGNGDPLSDDKAFITQVEIRFIFLSKRSNALLPSYIFAFSSATLFIFSIPTYPQCSL